MTKTLPKKCHTLFSQLLYICFLSLSLFGIIGVQSANAETAPYFTGTNILNFPSDWQSYGSYGGHSAVTYTKIGGIEVSIPGDYIAGDSSWWSSGGHGCGVNYQSTIDLQYCNLVDNQTYYIYGAFDAPDGYWYPTTPSHFTAKYSFVYNSGGSSFPPETCTDPSAANYGQTPPCTYDFSTRILTLNPLQNEATSSAPAIFGTFYNHSSTYNQLLLDLSWVEPSVNADLLLSGLAHRQFIFDIGTSTADQSFSTTTSDLLTGRWLMSAQFSNGLSGSDYFTASSTTFIVGTSSTLYSQFYEPYTASTSSTTAGSVISDCSSAGNIIEKSLCSLGDRIRDVLQFLFIPDSSVVAKYQALKDNILSRVPFGYFPLVKNALLSASASSTPVYTYIMPVARQPLFGSLRTGLAAILYLWWIIHMFHRFKSIQL